MKSVRLGDVAVINPTWDKSIEPDDPVSFVGMASMSDEAGKTVDEEIRTVDQVRKGYTPFRRDDLLIAKITPCFENGKIGRAAITNQLGAGSTEFHVVRPSKDLDGAFALHFLRRHSFRAAGELRMTGSGGQRRVPAAYVADAVIPLPPLDEQRRIAAILDKADELRNKRRQALAHLDALTQSIFHSMFGDPAPSATAFPVVRLADACHKITDGTHHSPSILDSGVPYITAKHLRPSGLDFFQNPWFISHKDHEEIYRRCDPKRGDVLYIKDGATTGVAAVNPYDFEFSMLSSLALIRPAAELTADYLTAWLNNPRVRAHLIRGVAGAAITRFTLSKIKEFKLPLPPLELQQAFATRIAAVERLKETHRKHLTELDTLFASLQHRAFRGEL